MQKSKSYCATFFNGCMTRNIVLDLPWYSPEVVARFLQRPPMASQRRTQKLMHQRV